MRKRQPHSHRSSQHPIRPVEPRTNTIKSQWMWVLGAGVGGIAFFWLLKPVLGLLSASAGIAYICNPLVKKFESRGFSREKSILVLLLVGMGIGLIFLLGLLPPVIVQMDNLSYDIEKMIGEIEDGSQDWVLKFQELTGWNPQIDWTALRTKIRAQLEAKLTIL